MLHTYLLTWNSWVHGWKKDVFESMLFHYRNHCSAFTTGTHQQSLSTLRDAVRRSNLTFQSFLCFIPCHWRCTPVTLMDGPLLNPIWSSQPRLQCYRQADCRSNGIQNLSKLGQNWSQWYSVTWRKDRCKTTTTTSPVNTWSLLTLPAGNGYDTNVCFHTIRRKTVKKSL